MQKLIFTLALAAAAHLSTQAQDHTRGNGSTHNVQPPANVQKSFQQDNPAANQVNWQQSNQQWHSSHTDPANNQHVDNYYKQDGNLIDTHRQVNRTSVPAPVDNHVRSQYHANDYSVTRIDRPKQSAIFQLDIQQHHKHRRIYTDDRGHEVHYNDRH